MKRKRSAGFRCYLCKVGDPNEEHFDSRKHGICILHSASLWELARGRLTFDLRGATVVVRLEKPWSAETRSGSSKVRTQSEPETSEPWALELSTGYEVAINLSDPRKGMEHLSRALLGEVFFPVAKRGKKADKAYPRAIQAVVREIAALLHKMSEGEAKALLHAVIWGQVLREIERQEERQIKGN